MERIKSNEIEEVDLALRRVHKVLIKRGLLKAKGFIYTFALALVLLLCTATLQAQYRYIQFEGTQFTIETLMEELQSQADIGLRNRGAVTGFESEVIGDNVSQYMVRDVVDMVLSGTSYDFYSVNTYTFITIERANAIGRTIEEQVFVEAATGRVLIVENVSTKRELGVMTVPMPDMPVGQVFQGNNFTFRSTGIFTIITLLARDEQGRQIERQIIVDAATGNVVTLEDILTRHVETTPAGLTGVPVGDRQPATQAGHPRYLPDVRFPGPEYLPRFAIKTNLLYGATTTPNLGAEFLLNRYFTFDIAAGWNRFVYRNNRKFWHWMVQPTLRFWIQEPFNGHFLGVSLMYVDFNISDIRVPYNWFGLLPDWRNHRFRGHGYGASLQYGHQWVLSPRWSIETSINVGYLFLDYRRFEYGWCGEFIHNNQRHYFGITNAAISLIYVFR